MIGNLKLLREALELVFAEEGIPFIYVAVFGGKGH